jgi:hypothetical protein
MNKRIGWILLGALWAAPALARNAMEDPSADVALLTWRDPANWQAGLSYAYVSRQVVLDGVEWRLRGDIVDAAVGVSPWPWLLLYGQAGASQARLDGAMQSKASPGAGGLLGARVNLWQLYEGVHKTAWRLTLQVAAQHAVRTSEDDGEGELHWSETLVMLPLSYHLTFARSFRNYFMAEYQALNVYAGPAYSKVDGTWTRQNVERDFEEEQEFGVVGGVDLWLLENLAFGVRADWFEETSMQVRVLYRF